MSNIYCFLLLWAGLLITGPGYAQSQFANKNPLLRKAVPYSGGRLAPSPDIHPGEQWEDQPFGTRIFSREREVVIGQTTYDVQTYASMPRFLASFGEGEISAIWGFGLQAADYPDRGTAYNHYDGAAWGAAPASRIEGDTRTGFPAFTVTASGREVAVAHKTPPPYELRSYTKMPSGSGWQEASIPTATPAGQLWPMIAAGGPDGESLHLLGLTTSPSFGGQAYEGMDQHLLYSRSTDGGQTWDLQDVILPGLDSSLYLTIGAQNYSIDARGETVAIAVFEGWGDLVMFKSTDNGDSWERRVVLDFPVDKFTDNYTLDDIGGVDPNGPGALEGASLQDSLAIFTSDGSGNVLIGNDGMVHVFFGQMYVTGQDGSKFFYPGTGGLAYWNETMATGEYQTIADLEDFDGDGMINIGDYGAYNTSLTSHPSAGIDAEGNIYLAYAAVREDYLNTEDAQNYRQIFVIKSEDEGASWTAPFGIINEESAAEPFLIPFTEGVFPSIARNVGEAILLTYEQDFRPGLTSWGDEDAAEGSFIVFLELDKATFLPVATKGAAPAAQGLLAFPNPARGAFSLSWQQERAARGAIEVHNLFGQLVFRSPGNWLPGPRMEQLELSLEPGVYVISLAFPDGRVSRKLAVH